MKKKFDPENWAVRFHFGKISLDTLVTLETTKYLATNVNADSPSFITLLVTITANSKHHLKYIIITIVSLNILWAG